MEGFTVKDVCGQPDLEDPSWRCWMDLGHPGQHSYCPFRTDLRPVAMAGRAAKGWKPEEGH